MGGFEESEVDLHFHRIHLMALTSSLGMVGPIAESANYAMMAKTGPLVDHLYRKIYQSHKHKRDFEMMSKTIVFVRRKGQR